VAEIEAGATSEAAVTIPDMEDMEDSENPAPRATTNSTTPGTREAPDSAEGGRPLLRRTPNEQVSGSFHAGSVQFHVDNWQEITSDK
jgi:hypothetical protein